MASRKSFEALVGTTAEAMETDTMPFDARGAATERAQEWAERWIEANGWEVV